MTDHTVFALIGTLGLPELIIIFFILMLIFGANRLSGLGKGRGRPSAVSRTRWAPRRSRPRQTRRATPEPTATAASSPTGTQQGRRAP